MGKFSRSWELVKQNFAILRSDKQLMLFPVFSAVSCFILTAMIATFLAGISGMLVGFVLLILYALVLSVFMSAVGGIFNAALYRYSCFKQVPRPSPTT